MFKLPRGVPQTSTTIRVHLEASVTSSLPGAVLQPEYIPDSELHADTPKSSPPHGLLHSETLSASKILIPNLKLLA